MSILRYCNKGDICNTITIEQTMPASTIITTTRWQRPVNAESLVQLTPVMYTDIEIIGRLFSVSLAQTSTRVSR